MNRQYKITTYITLDKWGGLFVTDMKKELDQEAREISTKIKNLLSVEGYSRDSYFTETKEVE